MTAPKAAAIYVRLSLDKSGEGVKVQDQEASCREFAKTHGLTVGKVYVDNDLSATTGVRRPAFESLLIDRPDAVIVWHQDRLLRVSKDLERVLEAGLVVHAVQAGTLDLATPTGRAVARTVAAWSTYEGEHKAERQRLAHRNRAARGDSWWARRPLGYELDLTINATEADAIRKAYDAILNGRSSYSIAKDWNELGIRMPSGPNGWQGRRVTDLLKQPRYAGLATYKGTVVGKGQWEAIVDEGTFNAVLAILSDPKRKVGGAPRYSLLSGVLRCGRCGTAMNRWKGVLRSGKPFDRYRCNKCTFMCDAAWAEADVTSRFLKFLKDADAETEDQPDASANVDEIARLEDRLVEMAEAYAREDVSLVQMTTATKALETRIAALRADAAEAARTSRSATAEEIAVNWEAMSTDEQREALSGLIDWTVIKDPDGTKRIDAERTWRGVRSTV